MAGSLYIICVILRYVQTYTITTTEYKSNDDSFIFAPQGSSKVIKELQNAPSVTYCASFCVLEKCIAYSYSKQKQSCRLFSDVICDKTPGVAIPRISFYRKNKETATALQVLPNPVLKYTECRDAPGVGVYTIWPTPSLSVQAYCDYGGWTVFQRRLNGALNFNKLWVNYKNGFGNVNSEYWLGNDVIHLLSSNGPHELRVELETFDCRSKYAEYSTFRIENEAGKYKITVTGYSGTAGNAMDYPKDIFLNNGKFFSTKDRDNDVSTTTNCADYYNGAWWHSKCTTAHLNGVYTTDVTKNEGENVFWFNFEDPESFVPMAKTKMALRRRS